MIKHLALALVAAAALAGCAGHHHHHGGGEGPRSIHFNPMVSAKGGVVSIAPEPLVFLRSEKNVDITWRLPPGLSFPRNGIVIEGRVSESPKRAASSARQVLDTKQDEIVCPPQEGGQTFTCKNRNSRPGVYKYTIRVLQDGKPLPAFDPEIMNLD